MNLIWVETVRDLSRRFFLWTPFLWLATLEALVLVVLACGQHAPLSVAILPPVRIYLGDRFTSYPLFYAFVAEYFGVVRQMIEFLIAPFAVAVVAARVAQINQTPKERRPTAGTLLTRYASFALFGLLPILLTRYGMAWSRLLLRTTQADFGLAHGWMGLHACTIAVGILVSVAVQISFLFSIPICAIERESIWGALKRGFIMGWRHPFIAGSIAVIPSLVYFVADNAQGGVMGVFMNRWPDTILGYSFFMILVACLVNTVQATAAAHGLVQIREKVLAPKAKMMPSAVTTFSRKRIGVALSILICCLTAGGCGATTSQRDLWEASQIKKSIFEKPQEVSAGDYSRARDLYQKVLVKSTVETEKAEASVSLGELAAHQGNLEDADTQYQQTLTDHASQTEVAARAIYGRARVAENRGRWKEAKQYYQELLQKYDESPLAMTVPIQLARTARRMEGEQEGRRAYQEAETYYANIYNGKPKTRRALNALSNQFLVYAEQKKWPEALNVLEKIQSEYPGTPEAKNAFVTRAKMVQAINTKLKAQK